VSDALRGCYEETAAAEFRLIANSRRPTPAVSIGYNEILGRDGLPASTALTKTSRDSSCSDSPHRRRLTVQLHSLDGARTQPAPPSNALFRGPAPRLCPKRHIDRFCRAHGRDQHTQRCRSRYVRTSAAIARIYEQSACDAGQ